MRATTGAAEAAAVAPSTIERWADQGILPFSRTAGGHRRTAQPDYGVRATSFAAFHDYLAEEANQR